MPFLPRNQQHKSTEGNIYKIHHTTNDKTHSLSGHQQCQITTGSFAEKSMDLQQMTNSKLFQRNTKQKLTNSNNNNNDRLTAFDPGQPG